MKEYIDIGLDPNTYLTDMQPNDPADKRHLLDWTAIYHQQIESSEYGDYLPAGAMLDLVGAEVLGIPRLVRLSTIRNLLVSILIALDQPEEYRNSIRKTPPPIPGYILERTQKWISIHDLPGNVSVRYEKPNQIVLVGSLPKNYKVLAIRRSWVLTEQTTKISVSMTPRLRVLTKTDTYPEYTRLSGMNPKLARTRKLVHPQATTHTQWPPRYLRKKNHYEWEELTFLTISSP